MVRLILMRHGNTFEAGETPVQVGARTDLPLTAAGRLQAGAMSEYLRSVGAIPKAIYAGSLKRQTESAAIIARNFDLRWIGETALTEIDYGVWEGLTADQIASKWPKEHAEWNEGKWQSSIFGGCEAQRRCAIEAWFDSLRKTYEKNDLVLGITSNGLLRSFQDTKVKTGHFCEFDLLPDGVRILSWNRNPKEKISLG